MHDGSSPSCLDLKEHNKEMVQDSPDPELTVGFIKKERFKFNLKCRDGV